MSRYDAALFDLDGTILDTSEGILKSISETVERFDLIRPDEAVLRSFIGPPIEWSFEKNFGLSGEPLREAAVYFRRRYAEKNLLLAVPYEGIYELLGFLKENGTGIAVATYKRQDYAVRLLEEFGFNRYTDLFRGSDSEGRLKKSDIIDICIEELGCTDRGRVLMVGDSKHDAAGAEQAGVAFAGVSYGFGFGSGENIDEYKHVAYVGRPTELERLFED